MVRQYFYTIKDLRAAIASLSSAGTKSDDGKFTDDDLKRHRVGGRLVTRREISSSIQVRLADGASTLMSHRGELSRLFIVMGRRSASAISRICSVQK